MAGNDRHHVLFHIVYSHTRQQAINIANYYSKQSVCLSQPTKSVYPHCFSQSEKLGLYTMAMLMTKKTLSKFGTKLNESAGSNVSDFAR
jgi:hypothetical protein